jgi:hypothetical protein
MEQPPFYFITLLSIIQSLYISRERRYLSEEISRKEMLKQFPGSFRTGIKAQHRLLDATFSYGNLELRADRTFDQDSLLNLSQRRVRDRQDTS